jgi:hypothetical protein
MNYCENCGKEVSPKANFCGHCGQRTGAGSKGGKEKLGSGPVSPSSKQNKQQDGKVQLYETGSAQSGIKNAGRTVIWLSIVLTFFNSAVPFYILYHPGLLYYASAVWPRYEQVGETWNAIYILIVANIVLGIINRQDKLFLISGLLSVIYMIGLNLYPINYFHFSDMPVGHKVNTESLIYSLGLIGFNNYLFFKMLKLALRRVQ